MDELVDIVDGQDQVVAQAMKSKAHADLLIHRTVHGVVMNSKQQIFLVQRVLNREKGPGLRDASVGGHVLAGESYAQAIIREGREELGIPHGDYQFVTKYFSDHPRMKHMCAVFTIVYEGELIVDPREFDHGDRMDYADIMALPAEKFTPDYRITLEKLASFFV